MGRSARQKLKAGSGMMKMILLLSFFILVLFLWGRVHIDFVLHEIDALVDRKQSLLMEIDDLQIQVDALQQYQRIVSLAKDQGLVFVNRSEIRLLAVDISGLQEIDISEKKAIQIAGFGPLSLWQEKSFISTYGETHVTR